MWDTCHYDWPPLLRTYDPRTSPLYAVRREAKRRTTSFLPRRRTVKLYPIKISITLVLPTRSIDTLQTRLSLYFRRENKFRNRRFYRYTHAYALPSCKFYARVYIYILYMCVCIRILYMCVCVYTYIDRTINVR